MERKRNYIETVRDWADERLRRLFGRITPGKRLAVILVMSALFTSGNGTGKGCKSNTSGSSRCTVTTVSI